jgi:hypothetical protein
LISILFIKFSNQLIKQVFWVDDGTGPATAKGGQSPIAAAMKDLRANPVEGFGVNQKTGSVS